MIGVNAFAWSASTPVPVWSWKVDDETVFGLKTPYYIVEYDSERRAFRGFAYREHNDPSPGVFWARPRGERRVPSLDAAVSGRARAESQNRRASDTEHVHAG